MLPEKISPFLIGIIGDIFSGSIKGLGSVSLKIN